MAYTYTWTTAGPVGTDLVSLGPTEIREGVKAALNERILSVIGDIDNDPWKFKNIQAHADNTYDLATTAVRFKAGYVNALALNIASVPDAGSLLLANATGAIKARNNAGLANLAMLHMSSADVLQLYNGAATLTAAGVLAATTFSGAFSGSTLSLSGNATLTGVAARLKLVNSTAVTGQTWELNSETDGSFILTQVGILNALTITPATGAVALVGPFTVSMSTPTVSLVNTASANKTWQVKVSGTTWQLNEAGVNVQLAIAAGGAATFTGAITATNITGTGDVAAGATKALFWTTRASILSPADSIICLTNNAGTDFARLQFGGTTASFPALKRSATVLAVRLADDSADAAFTCGALTLSATLSATTATFSGALTYGGVTLSNSVTGTGSMVLSAAPTFTGTVVMAAINAATLVLSDSIQTGLVGGTAHGLWKLGAFTLGVTPVATGNVSVDIDGVVYNINARPA